MFHLVHHPDYAVAAPPGSPYPFGKHGMVMLALRESGADFVEHVPDSMPRPWLEAVHDPAYVAEVLSLAVPREKERRIGFPVTDVVARRSQLAPGGTWLAARLALTHGFAANTAGGSHHALADSGAGYCVFNDLAIAAHRLLAEGDVRRLLIVDLDVHQGDGTAMLLAGREEAFTFSIHGEKNFPARKASSDLDVALPDRTDDAAYLDTLAAHLPLAIDRSHPDIILYQAGVDSHAEDRLGRLALSDAGLEARDRLVMAAAQTAGIPLASVLGGGYGRDVMAVTHRHVRSILTLADASGARP
ncbi:histone deacetylase family protein [Flavisphingomonas formosensis]|uniref:histone deacetylase family protein n=1 Tax=Flavisphingomonas formosensis TaxID=861534 RepID=UPI0012FBE785|nr:histone deacetylase [Sphingomonas formosensis]